MAVAKVQARGQVTLPRSVREKLGCKPGDTVAFRETRAGAVELRVLPRKSLAELLQRYHIEGDVDYSRNRADWEDVAARDVVRE